MQDSYQLYLALKQQNFNITERDPWWWPASGEFAVVVGALLTQQTRWEKVEESLSNLKQYDLLDPQAIASSNTNDLIPLIKPAGFYNMKSQRLIQLCKNLINDFGDFDQFQHGVTRSWLLAQSGIGEESADSILCYGCYREDFVVDAYTTRLLNALGHPFKKYADIQSWMLAGLEPHRNALVAETDQNDLALLYAHYHGMVVEYAKRNSCGKQILTKALLAQ